MAIAPLVSGLIGSNDEKTKISLNLQIHAEGCCGNVACCSSQVEQRQKLDKRRITFNVAANDGKGGFEAKEEPWYKKLFNCCCCKTSPQKLAQDNRTTREKYEETLAIHYGQIPAGEAIFSYCQQKNKNWETLKENNEGLQYEEFNQIKAIADRLPKLNPKQHGFVSIRTGDQNIMIGDPTKEDIEINVDSKGGANIKISPTTEHLQRKVSPESGRLSPVMCHELFKQLSDHSIERPQSEAHPESPRSV